MAVFGSHAWFSSADAGYSPVPTYHRQKQGILERDEKREKERETEIERAQGRERVRERDRERSYLSA